VCQTVRLVSLKATEEDARLLEALQERWGLSISDTIRHCLRDTMRRAHSSRRKANQQAGLQGAGQKTA
jgi:hypothetical protein